MRRGEEGSRAALINAAAAADANPSMGVDNPMSYDKAMLEAAKDYVNTVVGPNINGDRC